MSNTPETDKEWGNWLHKLKIPIESFVDFARKLERERDEAREDAKRATYDATQETLKVSAIKSKWIAAYQERDQWRECADKLAEALFYELSGTMTIGGRAHIALEEFYRLKEKNK